MLPGRADFGQSQRSFFIKGLLDRESQGIGAFQNFDQLPHIARPIVGAKRSDLFASQGGFPPVRAVTLRDMADDLRDILGVFPEGRNVSLPIISWRSRLVAASTRTSTSRV